MWLILLWQFELINVSDVNVMRTSFLKGFSFDDCWNMCWCYWSKIRPVPLIWAGGTRADPITSLTKSVGRWRSTAKRRRRVFMKTPSETDENELETINMSVQKRNQIPSHFAIEFWHISGWSAGGETTTEERRPNSFNFFQNHSPLLPHCFTEHTFMSFKLFNILEHTSTTQLLSSWPDVSEAKMKSNHQIFKNKLIEKHVIATSVHVSRLHGHAS